MAWEIRGRTALVTGAGKRIGRRIALALAEEGANVCIHYHGSERESRELASEVESKGVKAWLIQADFDKDEYSGLIERAVRVAGAIDMLVNSAAVFPLATMEEMTLEGLMGNIRVNAWAPFVLIRDLARTMKKGKVVNLLDSRTPGYDWAHTEYILSKHLFAELTRMAAVEYAPDVVVNGVAPGLILPPPGMGMDYLERMDRTVPLKKHGSPQEVAAAVVYLLKSEFLAGEVIKVDGGRHLFGYDRGPHPD